MKTQAPKLQPIKTVSHFKKKIKNKKARSLEEMANSKLGQEMYKMSLEYFVIPGRKGVLKDVCQRVLRGHLNKFPLVNQWWDMNTNMDKLQWIEMHETSSQIANR